MARKIKKKIYSKVVKFEAPAKKAKWSTMWWNYLEGKEANYKNALQYAATSSMKLQASVQHAISRRIANRAAKRTYKKKTNPYSNILSHRLYACVAEYYEQYYTHGIKTKKRVKKDEHTFEDHYTHTCTAKTKNKNYRHSRYDAIIEKELKVFDYDGFLDDDKFLRHLYSKLPCYSFTDEERELWKSIYAFATTEKVEFVAVKRSDRRTKKIMTCTYIEFAEWYAANSADYSCNSRFFVPLFMEHCKPNATSRKVDELLRYDVDPKCFGLEDLHDVVAGASCQSANAFFTVLNLIKKISKKK